jgi:Ras-related protein Rab-1A
LTTGGTWKAVLIGDAAVGKTSIRRKYLGEGFITSHIATLGVDFAQKHVYQDGKTHRLIIWDLSGQASFERVRRHYYQGCSSLILVYSISDRDSFDNASKWLVEAFKYMGELPPTIVVGNKIDLRSTHPERKFVTTQEGSKFTERFKKILNIPAIFIETSAKTGKNIQKAFKQLIDLMIIEESKR